MRAALEALLVMLVAALAVSITVVVRVEAIHERAGRRYAQDLRECERVAEERAARARVERERPRTVAKYALEVAERQRQLFARGRAMSAREQVRADVPAVTGEHDRIEDITAIELLAFAALVDGLRERPATAVDRTDPDTAAPW